MYAPQVTEESLAGSGFTLEDFEDDFVEVWPENHEVFGLFSTLQTQWRTGMSGPTSFDYNTLFTTMTLMEFDKRKQVEMFQDIRVMEAAALNEIHRKKD